MMQIKVVKMKKRGAPHLRLLLLSDMHGAIPHALVRRASSLAPDAILLCGDMVNGSIARGQRVLALFKKLARIAPVLYSLGNHEDAPLPEDERALARVGVTLLDDSFVAFRGALIGGLSSGFLGGRQSAFMKTSVPDLSFLSRFSRQKGFRILLSHHPEYYPRYIEKTDIDLVLSGHAHGGQCRLFGRGLFAPGQGLFPSLTDGVHGHRLIISRGLSNTTRIPRLFNPTQMLMIELSPT